MPPRRPIEEIEQLGDEIYERDIRPLVEADHLGEIVAIDVGSGRWGLGKNVLEARAQLDLKRDIITDDVWAVRVGHPVVTILGGYRKFGSRRLVADE